MSSSVLYLLPYRSCTVLLKYVQRFVLLTDTSIHLHAICLCTFIKLRLKLQYADDIMIQGQHI